MTRREQLALSFFGLWTITGLYLDGWAHNHDKPETFFTPWHGVLYSGFTVAVMWFSYEGWRTRNAPQPEGLHGLKPDDGPDRLSTLGLIVFIAGAVGDFVWHEIFGLEVDLEALLSPTHLMLMTGGVLLVGAVLRLAWAGEAGVASAPEPSFREFAPVLLSTLLATGVVSFFAMYLSAFELHAVGDRAASFANDDYFEMRQIWGISSILFTNALLLTPTLLLLRRWRTPTGTFTIIYTVLAIGIQGMQGFDRPALILPALFGGVVADALVRALRPAIERRREVRIFAASVPAALWLSYFAVYEVSWGVGWSAELVTGSIVLAVLSGVVLSLLAFPMGIGTSSPDDAAARPRARTPERDPELLAS